MNVCEADSGGGSSTNRQAANRSAVKNNMLQVEVEVEVEISVYCLVGHN
jgi:hypothetical protein